MTSHICIPKWLYIASFTRCFAPSGWQSGRALTAPPSEWHLPEDGARVSSVDLMTQRAPMARTNERVLDAAEEIVRTALRGLPQRAVIYLCDRRTVDVGEGTAAFALSIHDLGCLADLVFQRSPIALATAHFRGQIDMDGDIYAVLALRRHLNGFSTSAGETLRLLRAAAVIKLAAGVSRTTESIHDASRAGSFGRRHSRDSDRAAISFHYDVSNDFYKLWLDDAMVYSCGYFETQEDTLEQAQFNKLGHVSRKLRLKPGDRLLDVGCGWGAMVCHAAKYYGVAAHGITLSEAQLEVARERIAAEGLRHLVTVELRDYRDLDPTTLYDKISSIGMFEHVGLKNMAEYNQTLYKALAPGGLLLNHGITHRTEGWNTGLNSDFLQRFVFPDGELDTVSGIQLGMERAGFEILDVEGLRPHYAKTLRHWVARLQAHRDEAARHVGEERLRVWLMYLAGSALEFEEGGTGIHQILAGKWGAPRADAPLTRRHQYDRTLRLRMESQGRP